MGNVRTYLLRLFEDLRPGIPKKDKRGDATAEQIRRLVSPCPICKRETFERHHYVQFACTIVGTKEHATRALEFLSAFRSRDWKLLKDFQEFQGSLDALIANVVVCPQGTVAVGHRDPADLWARDEEFGVEVLTEAESDVVCAMLAKTKPLDG